MFNICTIWLDYSDFFLKKKQTPHSIMLYIMYYVYLIHNREHKIKIDKLQTTVVMYQSILCNSNTQKGNVIWK